MPETCAGVLAWMLSYRTEKVWKTSYSWVFWARRTCCPVSQGGFPELYLLVKSSCCLCAAYHQSCSSKICTWNGRSMWKWCPFINWLGQKFYLPMNNDVYEFGQDDRCLTDHDLDNGSIDYKTVFCNWIGTTRHLGQKCPHVREIWKSQKFVDGEIRVPPYQIMNNLQAARSDICWCNGSNVSASLARPIMRR